MHNLDRLKFQLLWQISIELVSLPATLTAFFPCRKHIEKKYDKSARNEIVPVCQGDRFRAQTNHKILNIYAVAWANYVIK